jgi:hypothetical protein
MKIICNLLERHALVAFVPGEWPLLEFLAEVIQRVMALSVYSLYPLD